MPKGRIIAFEGVDGAGKSTALAFVAEVLRARGERCFCRAKITLRRRCARSEGGVTSVHGLTEPAAWTLREIHIERWRRAGDVRVLRRLQALREQAAQPEWVKARRRRASTEMDE